jgi:hypothetical protein
MPSLVAIGETPVARLARPRPPWGIGAGRRGRSGPAHGASRIPRRTPTMHSTCADGSGAFSRSSQQPEPSHRKCPRPYRPGTKSLKIAGHRLGRTSLTRRNVGGFHTPGNHTAETALAGWGKRIRTSELQKRGPSNCRVRSEGALPPRASRDTAIFDLVVLRRATPYGQKIGPRSRSRKTGPSSGARHTNTPIAMPINAKPPEVAIAVPSMKIVGVQASSWHHHQKEANDTWTPARANSNQESPSCGWEPSRRAVHCVVARGVKMQNLFH